MYEKTLIAIISASSALLGVIVASGIAMLQSWLDRKNKREVLLREKYEELGLHFLDSMKLPGELLTCSSHEKTLAVTHQSSGNKAHLLALVYFPLLQQATGQYIESYSALCLTTLSLYDPTDSRRVGEQVFDHPQYIAARDQHIAARDALQEEIQAHAHIYAHA